MNPRLILSLWRERWGKASGTTRMTPYLQGYLNFLGSKLAHASAWSRPGVTAFSLLSCISLFALILSVRFSLNSQIAFSVFFVCIALYVRRYAGTLATLVLIGLSVIASMRYLNWRFTETLSQDLDLDFFLGFGLCLAELYLWLLTALGFVTTIWPLKRGHVPMPSESAGWPTVDVFIPCQGQPHSVIQAGATAALALDWPNKKIKTYLLDDGYRDDIKEFADSVGATYLAYPENFGGKANLINRALPETKGELIAIFDCDQTPDKSFLRMAVGWFVCDPKLGMIQTLHHFLVPAPSERSLEIFDAPNLGGSCAMIRRSMLVEVGGVASEPVTGQAHTALKLQVVGYSNAYIGFTEREDPANKNQTASIERQLRSAPETFRVDHPFRGKTLRWKLRLSSLQAMLKFYYAVPRLIFFTAPLAYLLADARIIQTSTELFAAYALPHLIHSHIAQARMRGNNRFTVLGDIRETALAWCIFVPTTITLIRTELGKCRNAFKGSKAGNEEPFDWMIALPYAIILILNLTGFVAGIARLSSPSTSVNEIAILYLLWSAYNLMILAAMLAVAEESRHIRWQARLQLRMPAMVKLPSGRAISCMTENFPEPCLELTLPTPVEVEAGSAVGVSIFRNNREFAFPAQVASHQDQVLRVNIADAAQNDYRSLGVAVFSRGQDWPKWLPGRDADHPFPAWVSNAFVAVRVAALDFTKHVGKFVREARFGSGIHIWKRRK
ncbi:MAG: glycosyltransferase [Burkholderiaceae bacterium]|nr:glycosyltransferase [Burkholderiaceae bacterium]